MHHRSVSRRFCNLIQLLKKYIKQLATYVDIAEKPVTLGPIETSPLSSCPHLRGLKSNGMKYHNKQ